MSKSVSIPVSKLTPKQIERIINGLRYEAKTNLIAGRPMDAYRCADWALSLKK